MGEDSWAVTNEWALFTLYNTKKLSIYMESRIQTEGQALVITSWDLLSSFQQPVAFTTFLLNTLIPKYYFVLGSNHLIVYYNLFEW